MYCGQYIIETGKFIKIYPYCGFVYIENLAMLFIWKEDIDSWESS